jgi:HAD superfamily hydrolase (TIGR01459 family)
MVVYKPNESREQALNCVLWQGLEAHTSTYGGILCDIWGVVHNGVRAHTQAVAALELYRKEQKGAVILVSNAPRPAPQVKAQLENMGVSTKAYDGILTSGDMTQSILADESFGEACYHLGPDRDLALFDHTKTKRVGLSEAQFILCTGLEDDDRQTAQDYRELLEIALGRKLKLVCANPDVIVERDGKIIPCAGAIAELYEELGGEVIYFGKPHQPIYARAQAMFLAQGVLPEKNILAIGDGLATDIQGAKAQGLDTLFILGGIAADIGEDRASVEKFCATKSIYPHAFMKRLRW